MNRVTLSRPSLVSEASVTGPYRPSNDTARPRQVWANSENPLAPKPVRFANNVVPLKAARLRSSSKPAQPAPQPAQPKKQTLGLLAKAATLTGMLLCSLGVVGGFVSIVALGPLGLAVAAGAGVLGATLIKFGTRK
jgi:hypothetical protein